MAEVSTTAHCATCKAQTRHTKQRINHVLHFFLTIPTIGIWSIVWVILGITNSAVKPRCVTCGRRAGEADIAEYNARQQAHMQRIGAA